MLWAAAAVVMPWLVRGRSLAADIVGATVWSAGLAAATASLGVAVERRAAARAWLRERSPAGIIAVAWRWVYGTTEELDLSYS